jgi:formyltetrahydrofolate deformylase
MPDALPRVAWPRRSSTGYPLMQFATDHPYVLTASCASRLGTTAAVCNFLAAQRLYIMEMHQFDDTLSGRFFVRVMFCPVQNEAFDLGRLRNEFVALASAEGMNWAMHDTAVRPKVMIMVSHLDHCLEDLVYRQRTGELKMDIPAIVSNHLTLKRVADANAIAFHHLPITAETKAAQEARLVELIESTKTELVVLARYMQICSDAACRKLHGRVINIHHSFLPSFVGAKPYHQAHARGVKLIGATAHFVTPDLDEGPIIEQIVERVDHSFTPDMLAAWGRESERRALTTAVKLILEHRILLNGERTVIFH